ncbi:MAG: GNAT family N-acetyltransferase [Desulfovibrionaceae bacterium CG1_02_65_16]|nr:MAG: GNAT family N-acetyltransferase [Desulfovibrionaceae bacterium CG1_02_65_16]
MLIRPEIPADIAAIREINLAAFADHPYSRQTEHLIVEALRAAGALVVSLVAQEDGASRSVVGRVVGHIAFSRAAIDDSDKGWFLLGPVAVLPGLQRRGIGSALVRAGLDELRGLGAQGCVLVGDAAFYARFGFRQARGLTYPGVPQEFVLCLPLAGDEPEGEVGHHAAFEAGL